MRLNVTSEVGKLKTVLVHLPGREIDLMSPSMMEQLLFDDILYGQLAREEHRRFQQLMRFVVERTVDLQDLLEEALEEEDQRVVVLDDFCRRSRIPPGLSEWLRDQTPAKLADTMIGGIIEDSPTGKLPSFELTPVPNLFFMRDPQFVIGDGVAISPMATEARQRESLISHYVWRYHPDFRDRDIFWMNHYDDSSRHPGLSGRRKPTLEGGDVLLPRRDLIVVGVSERTNRAGVEYLAESLRTTKAGVKTLLVVEIPKQRSFMHLDTIFTIIDHHECLVYPPVILEGGTEEAKVSSVDLRKREVSYTSEDSLLRALKKRKIDLRPIYCGGKRPINQQREQWTDGANAFVLAPGVILCYDRNTHTAAELAAHGYHIIYEDDLLLGRTELETWSDKKYAIQISGHELSRARGGPRCMTMPLEREDI
jgi:arginine deiminase